jgi:hypothetical protein
VLSWLVLCVVRGDLIHGFRVYIYLFSGRSDVSVIWCMFFFCVCVIKDYPAFIESI